MSMDGEKRQEEIRSFALTSEDENGNITVSCHGAYYATRTSAQDKEEYRGGESR